MKHFVPPLSASFAVSCEARLYLEYMLDACTRMSGHRAGGDHAAVLGEPKTRDAVLWNLLVLGKAAKQVPSGVAGGQS